MKIANYLPFDTLNGEGIRCTVWVSGCEHHCKGCFNQKAMSFNYGEPFNDSFLSRLLKDLDNDYVSGVSLLGGEPLHPKNLTDITYLCKTIKEKYPNKSIWCWTGYLIHEVLNTPPMKYIDVLIDGKFEEDNLTILPFRGSANQKIWKKTYGWLDNCNWREVTNV